MTVSSTIRVHGHPFQVISDQKLEEERTKHLVEAMEVYDPKQIRILAEGKKGEPPLKIIYATRSFWKKSIPLFEFDGRSLANNPQTKSLYSVAGNTVFLNREYTSTLMRNAAVVHEIAHALDDFAVTRYKNFTMVEDGAASTNYANMFQGRPHSDQLAETFADVIRYVQTAKGYNTTGDFLTQQPFFRSIRIFLDNYPRIPGVSLEEQYDPGVWLPILRIRLW